MTERDRHWKVLGSKITYEDRWFRLRTDRCETAQGRILEGFHVVEFPDWINVIGLDDELNVILVREYRHGAGRIVTGLPSGILEASDSAPVEGARREMQEETGYGGGRYFDLGAPCPNPAVQSNRAHSFLAVGLRPGHARNPDPSEDIEVMRLPFNQFLKSSLLGQLDLQSIHLAACHLALGYILSSQDPALSQMRRICREILQGL
jgi:8-oxo-dGTP pyrophosphatase MutT (NUDIX family)